MADLPIHPPRHSRVASTSSEYDDGLVLQRSTSNITVPMPSNNAPRGGDPQASSQAPVAHQASVPHQAAVAHQGAASSTPIRRDELLKQGLQVNPNVGRRRPGALLDYAIKRAEENKPFFKSFPVKDNGGAQGNGEGEPYNKFTEFGKEKLRWNALEIAEIEKKRVLKAQGVSQEELDKRPMLTPTQYLREAGEKKREEREAREKAEETAKALDRARAGYDAEYAKNLAFLEKDSWADEVLTPNFTPAAGFHNQGQNGQNGGRGGRGGASASN